MAGDKVTLSFSVRIKWWVRPLVWCVTLGARLRLLSVDRAMKLAQWIGERAAIVRLPNGKRVRS